MHALAIGLRQWRNALPLADCPFDWSPGARIEGRSGRAGLASSPSVDRLVVAHGDPCAPNKLLSDDGIAVCACNTALNDGPGSERLFLEAYGVEPDPGRQRYSLQLWDRN